jgi:N,N'-diacetyllegionaminate synthase
VKSLLLIGGGGHCRSCIDVIEAEGKYQIAGIVNLSRGNREQTHGYNVLGVDEDLQELLKKHPNALITVGQIKSPDMRLKLFEQVQRLGFELPNIISPRAYVSPYACLGTGTIVMHDALINAGAIIGNNCILNTKSLVEHDAIVEDHCHISTGSIVNGGTVIREKTFVGSNTITKEYITIGKHSVIGGGLRVVCDVPDNTWMNKDKLFIDKKMMSQDKVLVIAEAGVNHNGSLVTAKQLVDVASEAGADMVKFQTFSADRLVTILANKAEYQYKTTDASESQHTMIRKLELSREMHEDLIAYCKQCGIEFFSTGFDTQSIDLLLEFGMKQFKIPSGEITNLQYLRHVGSIGKPVILSTGMATLGEIESALDVLETSGTQRKNITVLHCNTEYPTPMEDVNLKAMLAIRDTFGIKIGYSDHTLGIEVPIAAVAMGATVIEKHFTLDRTLPGPDHAASLEPHELKEMVNAIRNIEKAMGDGIKKPSPSEMKNMAIARKSIVAKKRINKGEVFTEENLTTKRPGTGISPMEWDNIIGKYAEEDYAMDDLIR